MKKLFSLVLAVVLCAVCFGFTVAEGNTVKLGVILLHDEDSTYDLNFINGVNEAVAALGLKKVGQTVIQPDNPAIRGQIFTVKHMVKVEELD